LFVDKRFLVSLGFSAADFSVLTRLSSWAVCGGTSAERVAIGRLCKRLIDAGRVERLRELGYVDAALMRFISVTVTPENVLLTATRRNGHAQ